MEGTHDWEGAKYALYANVWKIHAWLTFSWTGAYKLFFLIKPLSIASCNHLEASSVLTQRMKFLI